MTLGIPRLIRDTVSHLSRELGLGAAGRFPPGPTFGGANISEQQAREAFDRVVKQYDPGAQVVGPMNWKPLYSGPDRHMKITSAGYTTQVRNSRGELRDLRGWISLRPDMGARRVTIAPPGENLFQPENPIL